MEVQSLDDDEGVDGEAEPRKSDDPILFDSVDEADQADKYMYNRDTADSDEADSDA